MTTTITINNVIHRSSAQPTIDVLDGKSYMNLEVGLAPAGGSLDVIVTGDAETEEDLTRMVLGLLCDALRK